MRLRKLTATNKRDHGVGLLIACSLVLVVLIALESSGQVPVPVDVLPGQQTLMRLEFYPNLRFSHLFGVCIATPIAFYYWPISSVFPLATAILPSLFNPADPSPTYAIYMVNKDLGTFAPCKFNPSDAFVPNIRLNTAIERALTRKRTGDIHILFAPTGSGKTTAARYVLHQLTTNKQINGVLELDGGGYKPEFKGDLIPWISDIKGVKIPSRLGVDQLLHNGTVIFIDQFDNLLTRDPTNAHLIQTMIVSAAEVATRTKVFTALIVVKNATLFHQIIAWNGNTKVRGVFKDDDFVFNWTKQELEEVFVRHKAVSSDTFSEANEANIHAQIESGTIPNVAKLLEIIDEYRD